MSSIRNNEAIITKSLDGRITSWTPSAEAMFGYTAAQATGKHISIIIPFDYQDEEYDILDRLKNGGKSHECITLRRCKEGKLLRVQMTASVVQNDDGKIIEIRNNFRLLGEETVNVPKVGMAE